MSGLTNRTVPKSPRVREGAGADPRSVEKARAIFAALAKYIGAKTIYADNSPLVARFADALLQALRAFFQGEKELRLSVEQYRITWRGETVYDNREKKESLAFLLFKDGVGEIAFQAEVKPDELERFVELIRNEICSPSAHLDIVDELWQAEFANISYRVFDEAADAAKGEGHGAGGDTGEQQLRLNDHPNLLGGESTGRGNSAMLDRSAESLAKHLQAIVERDHPGSSARDRERHMQQLLESLFTLRAEELSSLRKCFDDVKGRNKLLCLLNAMLDFTRMKNPAPVARDVFDIVTRLVRSIAEEGDVPTLIEMLGIQKAMAAGPEMAPGFESLPQRIRHELTNTAFLLALGKKVGRSGKGIHEILAYFKSIGNNAVPAMRGILSASGDASIHAETCDAIVSVARDYIASVVEDLNLDSPLEARDAIYMLRQCVTGEVPPVVNACLSHSDPRVRGNTIEYLAEIGTDEAAQLLCKLLADPDRDVRVRTLAAVERLRNASIVAAVTSMCFDDDNAAKDLEELERLFRAVGKLGGASVLPRIKRMSEARGILPIMNKGAKQSKLLAISALRYIPGEESRAALNKLAGDGDGLVKSKAQHALKAQDEHGEAGAPAETDSPATGGKDV